jgi:hypothetical protein
MAGWLGSTSDRLCSHEGGSFFEPLQLHLEPADLLEQLGLTGLGVSRGRLRRAAEDRLGPVASCFFQPWISIGWTP